MSHESPNRENGRDKELSTANAGTSHEAQALDSLGIVVGEIAHDFSGIVFCTTTCW